MFKARITTIIMLFFLAFGSHQLCTESSSYDPFLVGGSLESMHSGSVSDAEISFQLLFNEILAGLDIRFTIKIYDDDLTLLEHFEKGEVKAFFISTLRFLDIEEDVHPTARYVVQYGPTLKQRYLLLTRNSERALDLHDFKNQRLSFSTGHHVGKRFLDVTLMEQGLPSSDRFFSLVALTKDANSAIVDLFFHNTDMALVPEHSYQLAKELNPQIGEKISVLISSDPMIFQIVCFSPHFPEDIISRFEPFLLASAPNKRLKEVMKTFRITSLHKANEDTLKEVRAINDRYISAKDQEK